MTWTDAFGLMRLLDEEHIGAPGREAEERQQQQEIARMQADLGDRR